MLYRSTRKEVIAMKASLKTKAILNVSEALKLYSLSYRRFHRLIMEEKNLPFVTQYRDRVIIIRAELEQYFEMNPEERERLKSGEPRCKKKGF